MKAEAAAQLTAMASTFGDAAEKDKDKPAAPPELFSEKDMREAATKFGEGVTFVSSQPIKTKDLVGRVGDLLVRGHHESAGQPEAAVPERRARRARVEEQGDR